jgi:hypothetical protein
MATANNRIVDNNTQLAEMEKIIKESYEAPAVWTVEVEAEGVVCASDGLTDYYRDDYIIW